jgi:hypothetical protein
VVRLSSLPLLAAARSDGARACVHAVHRTFCSARPPKSRCFFPILCAARPVCVRLHLATALVLQPRASSARSPLAAWPAAAAHPALTVAPQMGQPDDFESFMCAVIDGKALAKHRKYIEEAK